MKKVAIFVQARTGSKRFPKKILKEIEGKQMIWHVINRVKKTKIKKIVLLTTRQIQDEKLVEICKETKIDFFAGDEEDVLNRFFQCAKKKDVDVIVRITGDCPLIDFNLINKIVEKFLNSNYDYVSNTIEPTFPDGLDVEVFSVKSLNIANKEAKLASEREHVTSYFIKNPEKFNLFNIKNSKNISDFRWTVDEPKDLEFIKKIFNLFRPSLDFTTKEILEVLEKYPEIKMINSNIKRNEGYLNSIKKDQNE